MSISINTKSRGIFPILVVLGVFKIRKTGASPYRMPGFPLIPLVYMTFGAAILILAFMQSPTVSLIAIFTTVVGVPAYFIFKKRSE